MIKPLIIAAAFVASAASAASGERSFTNDGHTYVYSVGSDRQGRVVLTGRNTDSGVPFRYVINGQQVTGYTGSERVSFRIARAIVRVPAEGAIAAR